MNTKEQGLGNGNPAVLTKIVGISFFLLLTLFEFIYVMKINDGVFVYTLDDPYIHLALAENILQGHYGINSAEISAPSSSILWPFLLAPFSSFPISALILNIIFAVGLILVIANVVELSTREATGHQHPIAGSVLVILLILCTNLVGLVFIGMEHTLQILLVAVIAYGLLIENRSAELKTWLLFCIVMAPLVRYENMAISAVALLYLVDRSHLKEALTSGALILVIMGAFSLFLLGNDLGYLPTSVDAKINPRGDISSIKSILLTLIINHSERQALIIFVGLLVLFLLLYLNKESKTPLKSPLLQTTIVAILLHFLLGKTNWYNRYEIYIWIFFLLIVLNAVLPKILRKEVAKNLIEMGAAITIIAVTLTAASWPYFVALLNLPIASNNIFQQHYQMHRFATEYYQDSVAVNDIGYISYQNPNYVLDLFGLASLQALELRRVQSDADWMDQMLKERDIQLAMIYDQWFPEKPDSWIKLGELKLGNPRITPASDRVTFYATENANLSSLYALLAEFRSSLPTGAEFTFTDDQH